MKYWIKVQRGALPNNSFNGKGGINLTTVGYLDRTFKSIMDIPRNHFYVTLFNNGSKEVFPENTLTALTIQLAQPVDLGLSDWWSG